MILITSGVGLIGEPRAEFLHQTLGLLCLLMSSM